MRATLTIIFALITNTVSQICNYENSVELIDRSHNGIKYEDGEYIVDTTGADRGCVCMKKKCVRKCCPFGQGYNRRTKTCVDSSNNFNPPVKDGSTLIPGFNITKEFHFFTNKMNCSAELGEFRIPIAGTTNFHLKTDGRLYVDIKGNNPITYGPDQYCIDNFVWGDSTKNTSDYKLNALICFKPEKSDTNHYGVSSTCMLISCFFIILTVAVYACLPELRNLHGMVLMAYLLSFFVGFLFMATMQIMLLFNNISSITCNTFTFIIYFSILSAFFWLNVMCYDIWRTFRGTRSLPGQRSSARARFLSYSAYAFGLSSLLTILLIALEYTIDPNRSSLLPRIRTSGCFIYGISKFIYLYVPIVVLCFANMIFFSLTALKIADIKKQTKVLNKKDKQRFSLYIKLFIVMGVNWILEVISSFYPKANYIWQFTDAYNVLVGLIIFIIFVCKKKILKMIKQRYVMGLPMSRTQTASTSLSARTVQSKDDVQMKSTANNNKKLQDEIKHNNFSHTE